MKNASEMKQKTFFLVSQGPSYRLTRLTSKNAVDTTFKFVRSLPQKIESSKKRFGDQTNDIQ